MTGRLVLAEGQLEAHLLPVSGGSLARLDLLANGRRTPLLRGTDNDSAHALDCACFPLVPFCNRIRDGSFTFRGEAVRLAANMPPDPSPLHGHGWLGRWLVQEHQKTRAVLNFDHQPGAWPWHYRAQQVFTLTGDGLEIVLSCRNLSGRPMPCGLGLHPYYPCDSATVLDTQVVGAWTVDAGVLPVERVPATGRYDLARRAICGQGLDNGFDGWSGRAMIDWGAGQARLRLEAPHAGFFQVYSPQAGGLFVAEPVQHANCALNAPEEQWASLGMAVLQPGEERALQVRFTPVDQAPVSAAT